VAVTDSHMTAVPEPRSALALRRQFRLPSEDSEALDALGLAWEAVVDGGTQWLFIRDWPLPPGFTTTVVTLGVRIVQGYPSAALDMVYVHPPLARASGGPLGAVTDTVIDGRTFQQWSRHYSPQNPWRPDVDSIATHLRLIDTWFARAVA
jgi:hypothetical protein